MALSDARIKANQKWDKEHMITIGCRIKREQAEQLKQIAARRGKTANGLLKDYVENLIEQEGKQLHQDGK